MIKTKREEGPSTTKEKRHGKWLETWESVSRIVWNWAKWTTWNTDSNMQFVCAESKWVSLWLRFIWQPTNYSRNRCAFSAGVCVSFVIRFRFQKRAQRFEKTENKISEIDDDMSRKYYNKMHCLSHCYHCIWHHFGCRCAYISILIYSSSLFFALFCCFCSFNQTVFCVFFLSL